MIIAEPLIDAHLMDPLGLVPRLLEAGRDQGIHTASPATATGETGIDDVEVVKRDEPDEQKEGVDDVSLASGQLLPCLQDNCSTCDQVKKRFFKFIYQG